MTPRALRDESRQAGGTEESLRFRGTIPASASPTPETQRWKQPPVHTGAPIPSLKDTSADGD